MPTLCSDCGFEIGDSMYCLRCGALAPAEGRDAGSDDRSSDERYEQLRETVLSQRLAIEALSKRLDDLERARDTRPESPPPAPARSQPTPQAPVSPLRFLQTTQSSEEEPEGEGQAQVVSPLARYLERPGTQAGPPLPEAGPPLAEGAAPGRGPSPAERTWEWFVAGNWLARIGIVALILGVAFFISLAIDRGWLGEIERVILGALFGLALLAAGERSRVRYRVWAQTVAGGGLAILYLAIWGGFALYELYPTAAAFSLFILITLAGVVQALRHDSVGLAALAIVGGFVTPLLLQVRPPDERILLAYVLLLDLAVLALAGLRNWRWFIGLAWVWSIVLFFFWYTELAPSIGLAQTGISAIFIIFAGASIFFHIVRRLPAAEFDLVFMTLNAVGYLLISYEVMFDAHRAWMGGFTALLALLYAALLCACRLRAEESPRLHPLSAALMVAFAALTVPIQLDGAWVTMAWGAEALVLIWLSFRLRMREVRWLGGLVFIVSWTWLLAVDTPDALREDLRLLLNMHTLAYSAAIVLAAVAAWLLHVRRDALVHWERPAVGALTVGAALVATIAVPVQLAGVWISVAWSLEAMILLALSNYLRSEHLRWFTYMVLIATILRLIGIDTGNLELDSFWPVINWRFLPFAAAIASLYAVFWLVRRMGDDLNTPWLPDEARKAPPTLFGLATLMTLWILSAEVLASADSALFNLSHSAAENASILGLTLLWGIYGSALTLAGVLRRWRLIRVAGLALLIVSVIKLFAYDSQALEQLYRVIAFLTLGGILVAGGLLYQRHSDAVRGFLFDD